jgi:hypothetical protein
MAITGDEPVSWPALDRVIRGAPRDDRDVVVLGEILAQLSEDLARGSPVWMEVLIEDEDSHPHSRCLLGEKVAEDQNIHPGSDERVHRLLRRAADRLVLVERGVQ